MSLHRVSILEQRCHLRTHVVPGGEKHRVWPADSLTPARQHLDDFKPRQAQRVILHWRTEHILEAAIGQLGLVLDGSVKEAPFHAADHPDLRIRRALGNHHAPVCCAGIAHHGVCAYDGGASLVYDALHHLAAPHPVPLVLGVEIHVNLPKYAVSVAVLEVAQEGRSRAFHVLLVGIPEVHRQKQAAGAHCASDISRHNLHEEVHVTAQVWVQVCRRHGEHFHGDVGAALEVAVCVGAHAGT
mmetsp:Transcript_35548/g.92358  ORF Transcript_35548/g.92358 Transcript_35548/m.92358 type:complete len:242 (-) Transcript_35548:574-1299(-)